MYVITRYSLESINIKLIYSVAEKIFLLLRNAATSDSSTHFIAVSHSDQPSTEKWLDAVGGSGNVEVIVDHEREIFAAYGLGASSFWAVLNPWSFSSGLALGKSENIGIRPTESGSRWQTAGLFAVDGDGVIRYAHKAATSDDLGDLPAARSAMNK